jgi:hypothetical protein
MIQLLLESGFSNHMNERIPVRSDRIVKPLKYVGRRAGE